METTPKAGGPASYARARRRPVRRGYHAPVTEGGPGLTADARESSPPGDGAPGPDAVAPAPAPAPETRRLRRIAGS